MINAAFTQFLLGALALLLVVAAVIDIRTFTISNRLNIAVAAMAPLYWWAAGLAFWPDSAAQIGASIGVFLVLAVAFYAGMMGGGDVKLAAALALWFPPDSTARFLIIMALAGGVVTLAFVMIHRLRNSEGRPKIPYGVAIAIGGLAILTQQFLNQFA
jgi:prepilin peptidase CpaA